MSLIQEALKRKLEEQNNTPPAVAPLAAAPATSAGPSRGGAVGRILGFLILIVLLLGVAVALFYLAAKKWNWKDALAEARADAGQARVKWERTIEQKPVVVAEDVAPSSLAPQPLTAVQERVGDMKEKVATYERENAEVVAGAVTPAPVPAVPAPPAETAAKAVADAQAATRTPATGHDVAVGDSPKKGSAWPRIVVNGVMAGGKSSGGAAIINNRMVSVNESIEGARVIEVQSRGVLMEYKGEQQLLLIGQTAD